jgi:N-acetyl sugar amidotransferase
VTQCVICVMDQSDPNLTFEDGICQYCLEFARYPELRGKVDNPLLVLNEWLVKIKESGKGKHYDSILGISGGIDSSYLVYIAKKYRLRPLLVHVDGGFDSDLSNTNTDAVVKHSGFDFEVLTVEFEDFKQLQTAYFRSGVLDMDVPADYLIEALVHVKARQRNIQYILTGWNYHNEAYMPPAWTYENKNDYQNMMDIYHTFGNGAKLQSIPKVDTTRFLLDKIFYGTRKVNLLNYVGYSKKEAAATLEREWGWQPYRDKHGENILTRLYQRYILPSKFGIDKRRAHYSNLIRSGGMTREEALKELEKKPYDQQQFLDDKHFVLGKLGLTEDEFDSYMQRKNGVHTNFASDEDLLRLKFLRFSLRMYHAVKERLK